jgi:hypothetical protein
MNKTEPLNAERGADSGAASCSARSYRNIAHGSYPLSAHEVDELAEDFALDVQGFHVLAVLTKKEWAMVKSSRSPNKELGTKKSDEST